MDGNDFGKFNTRPAHKQKTRKINLGGWEEAESQAVDFCSAGREPVCPGQRVPGSVAAEAALGVLGVLGAPGWGLRVVGSSSHPSTAGTRLGERPRGPGEGDTAGTARQEPPRCETGAGTAAVPVPTAAPRGTVQGEAADCLVPFHMEAGNTWLQR